MKKLLRWLFPLLACFCIATVIAQLVGIGYLWSQGTVNQERAYQVLAILQGVDLEAMAKEIADQGRPLDEEQAAFEQIVEQRALASFDLDLRENAYDRGMQQLSVLNAAVKDETARFDQLRTSFSTELKMLQEGARDTAIQDLQQMIETMSPSQAKDQILLILEEPATGEDDPLHDILTVLRQMASSKQKKLFAEFEKDEKDAKKLHELIDQVRRGAPETTLIDEAQQGVNRDAT